MQIQQLAARLTALGLTNKQARVYVANMFLGPAAAQKIAEQAGLNRPTTYDILDELSKLGLVSRSHDSGKTVFITSGIDGLRDLLERQTREVAQRQQELGNLIPELTAIERSETDAAPVVRFVRGKMGVDAIWSYVVRKAKPGTEIFSMTNHDEVLKVYPDHLKTNPAVRMTKKLSSKVFYYNSLENKPSDPATLKEYARLEGPIPGDVTLYDEMAVLLSYGKNGGPWTGMIIENKDIVDVLRRLFEIAWKSSSK